MEIGVITGLRENGDSFAHVGQFGLHVCQLACGRIEWANREVADRVVKASSEAGVRVCAVWGGLPGPNEWNFVRGPVTLGLVPPEYRKERIEAQKHWADFAVWIGAPAVIT